MYNYILLQALTEKQKQAGFWLSEAPADPDKINLILHGNCMDSYNASTVRIQEIREKADEIMAAMK